MPDWVDWVDVAVLVAVVLWIALIPAIRLTFLETILHPKKKSTIEKDAKGHLTVRHSED